MNTEDLRDHEGTCVQLNVGREVWLSTLTVAGGPKLIDFRPTNEDHFERAPLAPLIIDERLLSALRYDRGRLIADAEWLRCEDWAAA